MEEKVYYKHFVTVDSLGRITDGFSDAVRSPSERDICINERGGYQFRLFPTGSDNPVLRERNGVPLYKYDGVPVQRTAQELAEDLAALPEAPPTRQDRIEAQAAYTAMMTGTLLEV